MSNGQEKKKPTNEINNNENKLFSLIKIANSAFFPSIFFFLPYHAKKKKFKKKEVMGNLTRKKIWNQPCTP